MTEFLTSNTVNVIIFFLTLNMACLNTACLKQLS